MAMLLRPRSCHQTLIKSSLSHLLRRHSPPSAAAAPALLRHFRAGRTRDDFPTSATVEPPSNWGVCVVPQQKAYIVERLGKYHKTLGGGLHFLIPFVDHISYVHSLKEESVLIADQSAITSDNVTLLIDGIVYLRIVDPFRASYEVENPIGMVRQMAQTTVRSEVGKMDLDMVFKERDKINEKIVSAINEAAAEWGLKCIRYEIMDISPPSGVLATMEMQVEAERKKRAQILEAEGKRQSVILAAQAEGRAIFERSQATAEGLKQLAAVMNTNEGFKAANLAVAQDYLKAFSSIAKQGTTLILPGGSDGTASLITQAVSIMKTINNAASIGNGPGTNLPSELGSDSKTHDRARLKELEPPLSDTASSSDPSSDLNVKLFSLQSPQK